jgi:hypothetical protein
VAIKALARQSDVEPKSVRVEMKDGGQVVFAAKPGHSLELEKIHAALKETRLSGKPGSTRAQLLYLELTVEGEVVESGKALVLKVNGTTQVFRLEEEPAARANPAEVTELGRLQKVLAQGGKVIRVTGRVKGWSGHFPAVLRELPGEFAPPPDNPHQPSVRQPPLLHVVGFEEAKK